MIIVIDENKLLSQSKKNILTYVLLSNTISFVRKRKRYVELSWQEMSCQLRDGTGQDFLDPTRPVNFKIIAGRPAGRPVSDRPGRPVLLQKVFLHCSMYLMKNFQKRAHG